VAEIGSAAYAWQLRQELAARNREWARGRRHVESLGGDPVIVYGPEEGLHGNFFDPAYAAILARPEWAKRFNKVHAQGRALPRPAYDHTRKWRELDSCMSSDALLMNVFCTPGVAESAAVRRMLGVASSRINARSEAPCNQGTTLVVPQAAENNPGALAPASSVLGKRVGGEPLLQPAQAWDEAPVFGWKARVPLKSGLFDRTEVDMRWGELLVEAKLTELDFQERKAEIVEAYRDFEEVFEAEELPRVEAVTARRRHATEFAEEFTQEWEETGAVSADEAGAIAGEFHAGLVAQAEALAPREMRYRGYQLIRNVLAAHAQGASFCLIHDARRPDLREAWFRVLRAVRSAEMRTRLKVLTWQELAAVLPGHLQAFLEAKYGIVAA